ncbi:MAG: hypothetical protein IJ043_12110 [Clostridia bacterium]|nr:hypothetical protein [Clostridia bacterium]
MKELELNKEKRDCHSMVIPPPETDDIPDLFLMEFFQRLDSTIKEVRSQLPEDADPQEREQLLELLYDTRMSLAVAASDYLRKNK